MTIAFFRELRNVLERMTVRNGLQGLGKVENVLVANMEYSLTAKYRIFNRIRQKMVIRYAAIFFNVSRPLTDVLFVPKTSKR